MNKQLTKLAEISQKPERLVIGLMSGTSLDGLDIALCKISGSGAEAEIEVMEFSTWEYPEGLRQRLAAVQSKEEIDARELTLLHSELGFLYGEVILDELEEWEINPEQVDLVASHGQTIFHAPSDDPDQPSATLQIGDGDHIAQKTGIITASDFRQKHTALGGEGAPLAAIFDGLLFRSDTESRLLLNIGGIANLTWLPRQASEGELVTGDTGPGNTLINEAMQKHFDKPFDEEGKTAASGRTHSELLKYLLLEPYFRKPFPKTTGQEEFHLELVEELMEGYGIQLEPEDLVATLTEFSVRGISRAVEHIAEEQGFELFVSGGGVHNTYLMERLKDRLPQARFHDFEELGIPSDEKEAVMMAFFGNELVAGEGFFIPGVTEEKVHLGKISLPG